ncbi:hypothetical protein ACL02O_20360 [Micromonospora sp. MS34]|uniref:hypothetical protein n=1 Tax=Micromonospora sp. MS34 TaxID=3385971 RepID=UPI0039A0B9F3
MTRVLLIATARPTFAVDVAAERAKAARETLVALGAEVIGPDGLVMTPEDVAAACRYRTDDVDLVINACASFSDATPVAELYADLRRPVLLWAFREPGPVGDRLWLNSLCGANLFGHALTGAGGEARLLYGDPDEPAVHAMLTRALAGDLPPVPALPAVQRERAPLDETREHLERLRGRRIGLVGAAPAGFTPCEYDADLVSGLFGVDIAELSVDECFALVNAVDPVERDSERLAAATAQPSLDALDPDQVRRSAAVTAALRDWAGGQALAGLAVRCWPEFPNRLGVCPCASLSRLADEGTATACERDVYGLLTMLLLETLGAGTTYLVDTVDLGAARNVVRLWHCGSAATSLAADPTEARREVHCNRRIGVAGNFPLRTGPVVLARLTDDPAEPGRLRLLVAAGESLPAANRFQGNTAEVALTVPAEPFVTALVTGGFPHHTVLAWTDIRPRLRAAADLLGIPVIEW